CCLNSCSPPRSPPCPYTTLFRSVSEGHPDKVCDRISDEVVDLYYKTTIEQGLDVWSLRCAAETLATTNKVVIAGEFRGTDAVTKDRKSTRLNSSHVKISYAVFCL